MSDALAVLGTIFGFFGAIWFSMRPDAYLDYLPLLGIGGSLIGASLALHGSRKS